LDALNFNIELIKINKHQTNIKPQIYKNEKAVTPLFKRIHGKGKTSE
jgi:hypothetical protein